MNKDIKKLPIVSGIYVFKNAEDAVIYIGKAKNIRKRVASYFNKQSTDWKVQALIQEYAAIEHIVTTSETEALLLEAQLVKKFKPKYNVLLKNGNPFLYILFTSQVVPEIKLVSTKKEKGTYFGPFIYRSKARGAYDYLMRTFKLNRCSGKIEGGCLDYHLGKCAGNCVDAQAMQGYTERVHLAQQLLEGKYESCKQTIEQQIKLANQQLLFEKSKNLMEYLVNLESIFQTLKTKFTETKYLKDITAVTTPLAFKVAEPLKALEELQVLLNLPKKPVSIDCFDISHFQSSYIVGSCIRFTHGIPDKNNFRRFKIKTLTEQNDFAALQEIVSRRYRDAKNLPDIIIIDGGKGQLSAVKKLHCTGSSALVSLAKKEELLHTDQHPEGIPLDIHSPHGKLIIALRDYAHHFAVSYHTNLRNKNFIS